MSENLTFSDSPDDLDRMESSDLAPVKPANLTNGGQNLVALLPTLILMALSAWAGRIFWMEWFSSIDRIVCTLFALMGLGISLIRSNWVVDEPRRRWSPIVLWSLAGIILLISMIAGRPKLTGISMGLAVAGWLASQMRGESLANAIALGMAFMIPSWVDACKDRGIFESAEHVAVLITSGLADTMQECNLVVGNTILFGHSSASDPQNSSANNFSCEGTWDSVVAFMGISLFCIYVFRRSLLTGLITFSLSFIVWMALRGAAWVTLAHLASINGYWYTWSFSLAVFLFGIGSLLIFSLDQFFGTLLKPIPMEFINPDFPLVATTWNWLTGLPQLTTQVPKREFQVDEVAEEELL